MGSSLRRYPSPLRYPGGKGKVANFLKLLVLENGLTGRHYVEPFAGGASVALSLLFEEYADHVHINDLDRAVYSFWRAALFETEEFCERIQRTEVTIQEWDRQRQIQVSDDPSILDLGFSTFFLNRTNRSGIVTGGIIGGRRQDGNWKLDARYNKTELIRRVRKVGRYRTRISLTRLDGVQLIEQLAAQGQPSLFYLDPPYYVKGQHLYVNFLDHAAHEQIATEVRRLEQPWLVSYDASEAIAGLYAFASSLQYTLSYSASEPSAGSEVMFFSEGLRRPDVRSPAGIPMSDVDTARRFVHS